MGFFVAVRDGGKTSEQGATRLLNKLAGSYNKGSIGLADLKVAPNGTPNMHVFPAAGDIFIPYQTYGFHAWNDSTTDLTLAASDASHARKSRIVAYIDLTVVSSASSNNPGACVIKEVAGTPASSPAEPNDSAVQSSVGSGNPWIELAMVDVLANATTITSDKITDRRSKFVLGGSGAMPPFSVVGSLVVANNLGPEWIVPPGIVAINRLDAVCSTAGPTGAALTMRLYNVTQSHDVGSVSIADGATVGSNTSMTNPSVTAGDVIRLDCTNIGSTVPGAGVTVQPST